MNHNHNDGLFIFIAFFLLLIDVHLSELPPVVEPEADGAHGGDEDDDDGGHAHHRRHAGVGAPLVLGPHHCPVSLQWPFELETKRRFAKVSIVSYSRPSLMIIASASQFHVYLPWGKHPFSIVS